MQKKENVIKSSTVEYLKYLIGPKTEIMNLEVINNKWLRATLASGARINILNE